MVGIWLVVGINNITVVWTDSKPWWSSGNLQCGKLVLRTNDQGGREKLIDTTLSDSASFACMLDSGNFVLYSKDNSIIWETFKYPTDTILAPETSFVFCGDFCEVERAIGKGEYNCVWWVLIAKGWKLKRQKRHR